MTSDHFSDKVHELVSTIIVSLWVLVSPLIPPFLLVGAFDFIDFIVGVRASRKNGIHFTLSNALQRTMDKLIWQGSGLIVAFLIEHFLIRDIPLFKAMEIGMIVIQAQSIREKIKILSGFDILKDPVKILKRR